MNFEAEDRFNYNSMWHYYRNSGFEQTSDVKVTIFDAIYPVHKYKTDETLQPFLSRGMHVTKLPDDDYLNGDYGTFFAYENETPVNTAGVQSKKVLYVVSPTLYVNSAMDNYFFGDHYTFIINKGQPVGERLQFHQTSYSPYPGEFTEGKCLHILCPLPAIFTLPRTVESFRQMGKITRMSVRSSSFVLDLMSRPFNVHQTPEYHQFGGGTKNKKKASISRTPVDFWDIWRVLPIQRLTVVQIARPELGVHDVTVYIKDRLKHRPSSMIAAVFFRLPSRGNLEAELAKKFKDMTWADFVDPPEDPF